jgi:hypothetical protein
MRTTAERLRFDDGILYLLQSHHSTRIIFKLEFYDRLGHEIYFKARLPILS